jgi:hypothetical protein
MKPVLVVTIKVTDRKRLEAAAVCTHTPYLPHLCITHHNYISPIFRQFNPVVITACYHWARYTSLQKSTYMPSLCKLAYAAHSLIIADATSYYVQHIYSHLTNGFSLVYYYARSYLSLTCLYYLLHISMCITFISLRSQTFNCNYKSSTPTPPCSAWWWLI